MDEAALIAHLGAWPSTSFQPRISVHRSNDGRKSQSLEPIVPAKPRSRTSSLAPDTVQKNLLVDSALVDLVVTDSSKPRIVIRERTFLLTGKDAYRSALSRRYG